MLWGCFEFFKKKLIYKEKCETVKNKECKSIIKKSAAKLFQVGMFKYNKR